MINQSINTIYVSYNSQVLLSESLSSFHSFIDCSNLKFFIVNNDFSSSFPNGLLCKDLNIKFLTPSSNLGFAKANNLAAGQSDSEYLCFLNPDTLVKQDFFTPIIDFINSHPEAGACAPALEYDDGSYQSSAGNTMGFWYDFLEATMLISFSRKRQRNCIEALAESGTPLKVGWVSGACMIIKKNVFDSIGGFTENYFLNYEDIDLCKKLEDAGYQNYIFPGLKCTHLDHKSFESNFELLVYTRYESRLIYS